MGTKVSERLRYKFCLPNIASGHLAELQEKGKEITRDTFKRYIVNSDLDAIEAKLGYSNKPGGNLAKNNKMFRYWKFPVDGVDSPTLIFQEDQKTLHVFQN